MFGRSRRNLARWFTLSMGSILIVFAGVLYYVKAVDELEKLDSLLYKKTRVMATNIQYNQNQQVKLENVPLLGNNTRLLNTELIYARWYTRNRQLIQFFGLPPSKDVVFIPGFNTIKTDTPWIRQLTLPVYQKETLIGYLQVGTPLSSAQNNLTELRIILAVAVPVTLFIISITGWWLGGLAMQPILQAYNQLERFTADASHELRNPLAAILSNARLGLLSPENDPIQPRRRLEKVIEITKSMSILVNHLLFLARHQGLLDRQSLDKINLTSLLKELADNYASQAAEQNLSIVCSLGKPIILKADPNLIRQAIANLLANACKYTPPEGKIEIGLKARYLREASLTHTAIIEISDNGIGIPKGDLPYIFDRFYRVDTERSRTTGGFGLGLAIVQQIIEVHGGKITVASVLEQGTTFTIELPL